MKKRIAYITVSFLFVFATGFILLNSKTKKGKAELITVLLPRNTENEEWKLLKAKTDILIKKIKKDPSDVRSLLSLISIYINEGRISGSLAYYNNAAMKCTEVVLQKDPGNFEGLVFKSMILLSQHRFKEGLEVALQVQNKFPYNAFVYGLIIDGNVELGNYAAALEAADKMISIRPDLRSYSRIAYLREIHGDIPGAIDAMKMAVDAGAPGDENTEWCRVQMGKLFEQLGKRRDAAMHYTIALNNRAGYPYALAGLARIAVTEKEYEKALSYYEKAASLIPDHTFKEGIVDIYMSTDRVDEAKAISNQILKQMKNLTADEKEDQNEDHEMAHAWMGVNNYEMALDYALKEYCRRPANIEVNETTAIVYYGMGEYTKALPYIEAALRTNCRNPELLCHAALIYAKSGDKTKAKMFLREALKNDPVLAGSLKRESDQVLRSLN